VAQATRENLGYLLAKASQRWNELLAEGFTAEGFPEVRPSYGSVLIPLLEEDGLRMSEIARRARLTKQTITTLVRLCERDGLVERSPDPEDGRATIVTLTQHARRFEPAAERVLGRLEREVRALFGARQRATLRSMLTALAELEL
jgi:DNA-binding MarR family transcriptional regulator